MLTSQQVVQGEHLSEQALRHWYQELPSLAGLNGYKPCFSLGGVLAVMVIRHLVKVMGISVGTLATVSIGLFPLCRSISWPLLVDRCILIDVKRGEVGLLTCELDFDAPVVLVPTPPFAEKQQATWVSSAPSREQLPLLFPAEVVPRIAQVAVEA